MRISRRTTYMLKRLHSLTGVVPVGLFLLWHLFANSYAMHGPEAFNGIAGLLAGLPYVQLIELFGIAVPILIHMVLGVVIITTGQPNVGRYRHPTNWAYLLQRLSGIVLVAYIIYHTWTTRLSPQVLAGDQDLFTLMTSRLASPWMFAFYVLGVVSAAWHFGNGLFGFAIHWGLATGLRAQRAVARVGYALFVILSLVGINSLLAFRHHPVRTFERVPAAAEPITFRPNPAPPGGAR
jgi:succinate dehydrogenase / fumarate reductase cytochrome b subunit